MLSNDRPLPDNVEELRALLIAERAGRADAEVKAARLESDVSALKEKVDSLSELNERLAALLKEHRAAQFGRSSEKLDPDQLALGLEDIEIAAAAYQQEWDEVSGPEAKEKTERQERRQTERLSLPKHLPIETIIIDPDDKSCHDCGGDLHVIGEEVSKRLDVIPAQLKIVETRRPKYGCRHCENAPVIAPAAASIIPGGLPTEGLLAQILVSRFADHLPLHRQAEIFERQGVNLSRATLAGWVGRAAFELRP
ncbi:MAG: transposase, partial [Oricola sp.]|nr:transposase [Oricola sp.]